MAAEISSVVFDLGGVLIDWNPRYLYRELFKDDTAEMENFLTHVCSQEWNIRQDAGLSFAKAAEVLKAEHPGKEEPIDAWLPGFNKMLAGPIPGTVDILAQLRAEGILLYALTNWSSETFPLAQERFEFLNWFNGIVVSGFEKVAKPDPALFEIMIKRHGLDPLKTLYIDDNASNIETAHRLKFETILFTTPQALAAELSRMKLLSYKRCA